MYKKILFVFNAGGLGDTVMTLPLVKELYYLSEDLIVLTHHPYIYKFFFEGEKVKFVYIPDLYYNFYLKLPTFKHIDLYVNPMVSKKSFLQSLFSVTAKEKIYYFPLLQGNAVLLPFLDLLKTCKEPSFFKYKKIAEKFNDELKEKDWIYPIYKCPPKIHQSLLKKYPFLGKKFLLINPFVKDFLRDFPTKFYVSLIKKLKEIYNTIKIVLVGGKDAEQKSSKIIFELQKYNLNIRSLVGKLTLEEFLCVLKKGVLFISPDSGPLNLSLLTEVKTIALFNFINPYWIIPEYYFSSGKVKSIFASKILNIDPQISTCWNESDQDKVKEYYPILLDNINILLDATLDKIEDILKDNISFL